MIEDDEYFEAAKKGLRPFSDFEWFAVDSNGHIAFVTSAGFAPIPLIVFRSKRQYFDCANYFENLPEKSESILSEDFPYKVKSWIDAAKRGLFAFDWNWGLSCYEAGKPYRLIAYPTKPLKVSELPNEIQEYLSPIHFKTINFAETKELFSEVGFPENNWSIFDS